MECGKGCEVDRVESRELGVAVQFRGDREEGRDELWVEVGAAAQRDFLQHARRRPSLLVGAPGSERVEDVADGADAADERISSPFKPLG